MRQRKILALLLAAVLLVFTACAPAGESTSATTAVQVPDPGEAAARDSAGAPGASEPTELPRAEQPPTEPAGEGPETGVPQQTEPETDPAASEAEPAEAALTEAPPAGTTAERKVEKMLQMKIGDTAVEVSWESNPSVEALKALCENGPLVIQMSRYGGFEQVGPIGVRLPSDDERTTTAAGDVVLYSSNQIVVFYGSNSWAYTRLGHITDRDAAGMADLLGKEDVTITISLEAAE